MAKPQKGEHCLNCGNQTGDDTYCSNCGQLNDTRRLRFWELVSESLSNFLALDGKIFKTLWLVMSSPGKVAVDFKNGKRVRYMNPVRLYFLCSLLLITSIQLNRSDAEFVQMRADGKEFLPQKTDKPKNSLETSLDLARITEEYKNSTDRDLLDRLSVMSDYLDASPTSSKAEVFGSLGMEEGFWNNFLFDQALKIEDSRKEGNFSKFNRAFLNKLFWILFLFIPVFGIVLHLMYWRRDYFYPEHLFFTLYQQSLFFLFAGLYNLFVPESPTVFTVLMVSFAIHLIIAMKRFYQQSWRKTLFKFSLINLLGIVAFGIFFLVSAIVVFILL